MARMQLESQVRLNLLQVGYFAVTLDAFLGRALRVREGDLQEPVWMSLACSMVLCPHSAALYYGFYTWPEYSYLLAVLLRLDQDRVRILHHRGGVTTILKSWSRGRRARFVRTIHCLKLR